MNLFFLPWLPFSSFPFLPSFLLSFPPFFLNGLLQQIRQLSARTTQRIYSSVKDCLSILFHPRQLFFRDKKWKWSCSTIFTNNAVLWCPVSHVAFIVFQWRLSEWKQKHSFKSEWPSALTVPPSLFLNLNNWIKYNNKEKCMFAIYYYNIIHHIILLKYIIYYKI